MKRIILCMFIISMALVLRLYAASHLFIFWFTYDGSFSRSSYPTSLRWEGSPTGPWLEVTEEQYNTGYTNLSPSVQADLKDQVLRKTLVVPSKRSGLVEQYFIMEINNTRNGATNQISEDSLMDWMVEQ